MKLNGIETALQHVNMRQVDGVFIAYDSDSNKVVMFNETSSFIWRIILEYEACGKDLVTSHIVNKIMEAYHVPEDREQEILYDVEEVLHEFFESGLLGDRN